MAAESAEAQIRLPTRQSQFEVLPKSSKEQLPSHTSEPVERVAQLPTRQSSAVQTAKIEVELAPAVTAGAISEDEISVPKELLTAEALSPPEGRASAISHPDFGRYLNIIEKRVRSAWQYPEGISGVHKVNLVFVLDQGGQLVRVRVVKSANSKLDNSAMQAMRRAAPFPPVPESLRELAGEEIRIRFTIDFGVKATR
jgi:protein TonB